MPIESRIIAFTDDAKKSIIKKKSITIWKVYVGFLTNAT
jgi:hypothetical protein